MKHILQQSHHLVIFLKKEYVSSHRSGVPGYHGRCLKTSLRVSEQKLVANIDESRILCGHCGIMCKFYARVNLAGLVCEPTGPNPNLANLARKIIKLSITLSFQIILLVMIFGCIIISDCGRMMIWKIQMAVEGSESWKQFLVYWKKFKRKLDTGCGLCPDLEIEGWETNSY